MPPLGGAVREEADVLDHGRLRLTRWGGERLMEVTGWVSLGRGVDGIGVDCGLWVVECVGGLILCWVWMEGRLMGEKVGRWIRDSVSSAWDVRGIGGVGMCRALLRVVWLRSFLGGWGVLGLCAGLSVDCEILLEEAVK